MEYLSETMPIYTLDHMGATYRFAHDEVQFLEDEGKYAAHVDGDWEYVEATDERPATWWTVAVYTRYQAYGGPEEGGWYYSTGALTEHGKVRFFDDYAAARAYLEELWLWVEAQNKERKGWDEKLTVRSTTEQMPDTHYPKKRPYYS